MINPINFTYKTIFKGIITVMKKKYIQEYSLKHYLKLWKLKQPTFSGREDWLNKACYRHIMKCHSGKM